MVRSPWRLVIQLLFRARGLLAAVAIGGALAACGASPTPAAPQVVVPSVASTVTPTVAPTAPAAQSSPTAAPAVVTSTLNLTYSLPISAPVDSYALDVYAPVGAKGLPVVVFLHGTGETKRGYAHFSQSAAAAGFVVYVVDWPVYTLSRSAQDNGRGYREVTEVVACAVRYARATAAAYGGDASKVTVGGFSAGAATAALVAFLGDEPERLWETYAVKSGGPPPQARCTQAANSAHVDAFVGAAGPYNLSTPPRGVDAGVADLVTIAPRIDSRRGLKVRLIHGTSDSLVPLESSVRFEEALKPASYDVKLTRFDGPHAAPEALLIAQLRELWPR